MKLKKCKICKLEFEPRNRFQLVCGYKCANEYAKLHLKKESDKLQKKQDKQLKDKLKTYSQRVQEARRIFQQWIRLRDINEPCISCGAVISELWDAGHFKKAEVFSGLIFHEHNCHKQCRKCNRYLNGNELLYRQNLVRKYCELFVEDLERIANETRKYKWSNEELETIKSKYKQLIKNQKGFYFKKNQYEKL